jgi:hypothetical protein
VDATVAEVFDWSDTPALRKRTPVIAVGCADPAWLPRRTRYYADVCIGGHVTSTKRSNGAAALRVFSNVPLRTGDSGGPLVASDGKLLAINTSGIMSWTGSGELVAASVRPDLAWVRRVIEEDRRTSHENTAVLPTTKPAKTRSRTLLFSLGGDQATPLEQSASSTPQTPSPPGSGP